MSDGKHFVALFSTGDIAALDFSGTILTISHDRYFLDKLCTRTLEIDGGIVRDYPGGFSYYQANRDKGAVLTLKTAPAAKQAAVRR